MACSSVDEDTSTENTVTSSIFDATALSVTSGNWYKPDVNTTWHWQLIGDINTTHNVELYDVDLFDVNTSVILALQNNNKKVICYFSAGSYENWRDDNSTFPSDVLGKTLDGWADEQWLDISNEALAPIMRARLDLAVSKGCDGVEPDNMDGYTNDTGFALSATNQLAYNKFIANESRKRGLSVALKNDVDQIVELEEYFDFSVNEQCHEFNECSSMQAFIDAGKPVLNAEYAHNYVNNTNGDRDTMCQDARDLKFKTLVLPLDLNNSFRISCD